MTYQIHGISLPITFPTLGHVLAFLGKHGSVEAQDCVGGAVINTATGQKFAVTRGGSRIGLKQTEPANQQELLVQMLDEVTPLLQEWTDGTCAVKMPWQVRAADWNAVVAIGSASYGVVPCFEGCFDYVCKHADGSSATLAYFAEREFKNRFGYGHNGPTYGDEGEVNARHDVHVAYALAEGKQVPDAVVNDYLLCTPAGQNRNELRWLPMVLHKPFTRGRLSATKLNLLCCLLSFKECTVGEITEENFPGLVDIVNRVHGADYIEADNLFYAAGLLRLRELPRDTKQDIGEPIHDLAIRLRDEYVNAQKERDEKLARSQLHLRRLSKREFDFDIKRAAIYAASYKYDWPNKVAKAVIDKDLPLLLSILDTATNESSQKVIGAYTGIKLRNVKAADRRKGVFAICGYETPEAIATAEARLQDAKQAQDATKAKANAPSRREHLRALAALSTYNFNGARMSGADFVDHLIKLGYDAIKTAARGPVTRYRLLNSQARTSVSLRKSDGTLAYAQELLAPLCAAQQN